MHISQHIYAFEAYNENGWTALSLINNFVALYGATVIYVIITALIGCVAIIIKNKLKRYFSEKEKQKTVKNAVLAEQCRCDKHGEEKLETATSVKEILLDKK